MYRWWWPKQQTWKGNLLESPDWLEGIAATKWRTDRLQEVNDTFHLIIEKPRSRLIDAVLYTARRVSKRIQPWNIGKARLIDRIQFMKGDYSAEAYPIRYAVTIQGLHHILPCWNRRALPDENSAASVRGSNIVIDLKHPEKVTDIMIEILEPRRGNYWAVGEIRIREVRLFGGFWRVDIQ